MTDKSTHNSYEFRDAEYVCPLKLSECAEVLQNNLIFRRNHINFKYVCINILNDSNFMYSLLRTLLITIYHITIQIYVSTYITKNKRAKTSQ